MLDVCPFPEFANAVVSRYEVIDIRKDTLFILAVAVESKVAGNILALLEILSSVSDMGLKLSASGALNVVTKALNSRNRDLQGTSLKILCNLSMSIVICHGLLPSIPRLLKFLKDSALAKFALRGLIKFCKTEERKVYIVEMKGCVAAVAELLESDNEEEQEESVCSFLGVLATGTVLSAGTPRGVQRLPGSHEHIFQWKQQGKGIGNGSVEATR
ncbi:hypothetical protein MLD38_031177 [Melastoma candidum]|uniref:Uncharacterized protein n=1 Tax=Melastoma candidum TaxID=119954 RepID=A0ACB9MN98_9MYRT|nr:hypothetical protein MLD38_031177 [Melastoma candidum]